MATIDINSIYKNIETIKSKIIKNNSTLENLSGYLDDILKDLKSILSGVKKLKNEITTTKEVLSSDLSTEEATVAEYKQKILEYERILNEIASKIKSIPLNDSDDLQQEKITNALSAIRSEINQINSLLNIKKNDETSDQPPVQTSVQDKKGGKKRKSYRKYKKTNKTHKKLNNKSKKNIIKKLKKTKKNKKKHKSKN